MRNGHQRIKIHTLTIEVNGNDCRGARRDRCLDLFHIHQEIVVAHVDEDWRCPEGPDR